MSINITVHGSPKKCSNKKRFLLDEDQAKRELLEERKKLRLKQVREKSKEVAQQVRRNVDEAKRKQLRTIEETKAREMWFSRGEKMRQKCEEYQNTLEHVGESHRAAAEENYCCPCSGYPPVPCKHAQDKWGEIRPTEPRPKKAQPGFSYNSFCRERAKKRLNKENLSPKADKTKSSSPISAKRVPPGSPCGKRNQSYSSDTSTRATLYSPYRRPTQKRRNGKNAKKKLVKTPSVILEIDSEDDSSGVDMEDTRNDSNMKFSRVRCLSKHYPSVATVSEQPYNCSDYKGTDSSSAEQIPPSKIRFTQITDLIKHQGDKRATCSQEREVSSRCLNDKEKETPPKNTQSSSPPKSPPKPTQEPPQRISSLKTGSKVSTKADGTSQVTNRVQFFDYCNKFQKSYPQPNVVRSEGNSDQPNAMQQAEVEKDLTTAYLENLKKLREKCESRSQKALEKEQIRRDCENLTAKLEALCKGKTNSKLNSEDAHQFSEARLKQVSSERQSRMNDAVENVIKRPVLITCPEVEKTTRSEAPKCFGRASPRDLNVFSQHKLTSTTGDNSDSLSTSDSCTSILLNYVNIQSKKVSDDISNCDNTEKVNKLKDLLEKINSLRKRLLEELEKTKGSEKSSEIKEVAQGIGTLSKERETILQSPSIEKEKTLEQREKKLKKREEILEKKLKEFYEITKAKTAESNSTSESVESEQVELSSQKVKTNTPLEIIIKLKDSKTKKSPYKIPRKRSSLICSPRRKKVIPKKDSVSDFSKTLEKWHADLEKCRVDLEKSHVDKRTTSQSVEKDTISKSIENPTASQSVENSCSTSYRSLPNKISPPLKIALEKKEKEKEKEKTTSSAVDGCKSPPPSLKTLRYETANIRLMRPPTTSMKIIKDKRAKSPPKPPPKKKLNPVLVHYIQRLLGMSRGSIEMLGVSTSEVDTPSSSIINNSANKSETDSVLNQKEKIARLEKFIQDSYSFASSIETSMRSMKSNSTDSSLKTIEEIWKRMLKPKSKQTSDSPKSPKPILKREKRKNSPQPSVSPAKSKKSEDSDKINLVNKYTQLTDTCTQRIAELTEMINKVRQEKQRILEITLSSASVSARSTTEYVDFAEGGTGKPKSPQKNVQIEQESDKGRLEKNKLTGVSRDSGISTTSRPATALDFRDSPGLLFCAQGNVVFEPILKDIPKPTKSSTPPVQPIPQKGVVESSKRCKPPATMARYSPQLDDLPHELSTIIEVDTTPRVSVSNVGKHLKIPLVQLQKDVDKITYSKFPTFEEYVRKNKIDLTMLDPDVSSKLQVELQELLEVANAAKKIQYKGFPRSNIDDEDDDVQESIDNLVQSLKLLNISMKRFPSHDEYVEQLKRTDIMQPDKSSDNAEDQNKSEVMSIESLPDIVGELIRRKMLKHSFRNVTKEDEEKQSESSKKGRSCTSQSQPEKDLTGSSSPKKRNVSRKDAKEELLSGLEMLQFSNQSNSDNIEKELEGMGLKWAALMLRKSQNIQDINSSTSSSILFTSRRKSGKKQSTQKKVIDDSTENQNTAQQESLEGRPLNLKDFLAKELQKRTQLSSSSSSQDDSLASQFLRSMFGSDSSGTRRVTPTSEQHTNRILTSTPVPAGSTSSSKPTTNHSSQKLFGAESLSTVRYSHSDSDGPSNSAQKLIPPNVRLECNKISSSSSNSDS